MSNENHVLIITDKWADIIYEEWKLDISPEQQPWLLNKIVYQARKSAGRQFIKYCEGGVNREHALCCALAYRAFSDYFADEKTDDEQIAKSIREGILGVGEEVAMIEKPEGCSDEEWAEAQKEAFTDIEGNLIAPQLEGFLMGAKYSTPCVYPSEFDENNVRRMVTNCMQSVLSQCQRSKKNCLRWLAKANTEKFRMTWRANYEEAKMHLKVTEDFIRKHELEYEDQ